MTARIGGASREHQDTQGPTNLTWHLHRKHSKCFNGWALSHGGLDDLKILRESILQLPKSQIVEIITTIQTVRCDALDYLLLVIKAV
jgi:hypothetical protein